MIAAVVVLAMAIDPSAEQEDGTFPSVFGKIREESIVHQILFIEPNGALSLYRAPKTFSVISWLEELDAHKREEYLKRIEELDAPRREESMKKLEASVKEVEEKLEAIDAKGNSLNLLT